jgi:negative regulator of flagellin synthesis FlgM
MTIERLGPVDPLQNLRKTDKNALPRRGDGADSVNLSEEARSKSELYQATETARSAPDVRADRVEEVKRKLQDPNYISKKVIDDLADRLMELFGIS